MVCLKGIYNFLIRREGLVDCRLCISGMVCLYVGLIWSLVKCDLGYYCFVGFFLLNEIINVCFAGTYTDRYDLIYVRECIFCLER